MYPIWKGNRDLGFQPYLKKEMSTKNCEFVVLVYHKFLYHNLLYHCCTVRFEICYLALIICCFITNIEDSDLKWSTYSLRLMPSW